MHHVGQRLPRLGMLPEHHEINRVAVMQRDADLAVELNPPIPAPCPARGSTIM
jgi:hypothetical protein